MNNFRSALRAGATAILVAGVILACGDIPESVGPAALSLPTVLAMSQGDSVQWSNNVLEMVVDGDTIRWERDQQDAGGDDCDEDDPEECRPEETR